MSTTVETTLANVLTAVAEHLESVGRLPGKVFIAPGAEVAWDDCCNSGGAGGQLYLRLVTIYPSGSPFPDPLTRPLPCPAPLVGLGIVVGVVRCAHTIDDYGVTPSAEELTGDSSDLISDAVLIWEALQGVRSIPGVAAVQIGEWTPEGPMGGCMSGEWSATLGVTGACWTEA